MSAATDCPVCRPDDAVARWVAGTLPKEEAERFEVHLIECGRCQEAVQTAMALRAVLRSQAGAAPRRRRWRLFLPLGLAAALTAIWLLPPRNPLAPLADPGPAPQFSPLPVRTADGSAGVAELGMKAYTAGDYARAARLLDSVLVVDPTPATRFFLGVSLLKTGHALEAAAALGSVARDSVNPFSADAALWLAKAWLRAGLPDSAVLVLSSLGRRGDEAGTAAHARALSDSIREVRGR